MNNLMKYKNYLVKWIREEVKKASMNGVIVGLSGGVDSSLVAVIAKEAFPNNSLGIYMPCGDMGQDLIDAKELANQIKIETQLVDISNTFNVLKKELNIDNYLAIANIKPRLRMTSLYAIAQEKKYLVLGTDNAAEWILGYFTKYGDGGVDLLPIIHLKKQEVKELAKLLNFPKNIYTKKSTAGLWENQTDEEELGFSYEFVDKYIDNKQIPNDIKNKIEIQIKKTEHKRIALPIPMKIEFIKN